MHLIWTIYMTRKCRNLVLKQQAFGQYYYIAIFHMISPDFNGDIVGVFLIVPVLWIFFIALYIHFNRKHWFVCLPWQCSSWTWSDININNELSFVNCDHVLYIYVDIFPNQIPNRAFVQLTSQSSFVAMETFCFHYSSVVSHKFDAHVSSIATIDIVKFRYFSLYTISKSNRKHFFSIIFIYSGTCLIRHTKGSWKCVGLYRMLEYSGFI